MNIPRRKKRRIWLAGLLSLIWPGLGQIYCGRLVRGIILVVSLRLLVSFSAMSLNHVSVNRVTLGFYLFLLFSSNVILSIDALFLALKTNTRYRLKEYNRWYCYLFFTVLITGFHRDCTQKLVDKYIQPLKILSDSMFPSLEVKDRLVVYKYPEHVIEPQIGDIIQFPHYAFSKIPLLKRVVARSGDTVEIKNNQLIINDVPLQRIHIKTVVHQPRDLQNTEEDKMYYKGTIFLEHNRDAVYPIFLIDDPNYLNDMPKRKVPSDSVFVLGDSRNLSIDSRRFGYVPESQIEGIARYLIWTNGDWGRWGVLSQSVYENSATK